MRRSLGVTSGLCTDTNFLLCYLWSLEEGELLSFDGEILPICISTLDFFYLFYTNLVTSLLEMEGFNVFETGAASLPVISM